MKELEGCQGSLGGLGNYHVPAVLQAQGYFLHSNASLLGNLLNNPLLDDANYYPSSSCLPSSLQADAL